jgi:hypothetical protein
MHKDSFQDLLRLSLLVNYSAFLRGNYTLVSHQIVQGHCSERNANWGHHVLFWGIFRFLLPRLNTLTNYLVIPS